MTTPPISARRLPVVAACLLLTSGIIFAGKQLTVPSERYATIGAAMAKAVKGDTIWVEDGVYREHVVMNPGVVLKARTLHKAVICGSRRGTVVTMARKCGLIGLEIRNGTFGVFTSNFGSSILQCRIVYNRLTGIINVRNLARIEDNIIAFNGASGIQTWDVGVSTGTINHNTIAFNGNHGIAVGGTSNVIIENNVIAYSHRFPVAMSGLTNQENIQANDVFGNLVGAPDLPRGNFSLDPGFASPRLHMDFRLAQGAEGKDRTLDHETMGARVYF